MGGTINIAQGGTLNIFANSPSHQPSAPAEKNEDEKESICGTNQLV